MEQSIENNNSKDQEKNQPKPLIQPKEKMEVTSLKKIQINPQKEDKKHNNSPGKGIEVTSPQKIQINPGKKEKKTNNSPGKGSTRRLLMKNQQLTKIKNYKKEKN